MGETVGTESEGIGLGTLLDKIDEIVRQGNVRRIVITSREGRKILDLPINAGIVAAVIAPMLTAAGAALAVMGGWKIQVEHTEQAATTEADDEVPAPTAGTPEPAAASPGADTPASAAPAADAPGPEAAGPDSPPGPTS